MGRGGKTSAEGMGTRMSGLMVTMLRPRGCGESSGATVALEPSCVGCRRKEKNYTHHIQHLAVLTGQTHVDCELVMRGEQEEIVRMKLHPAAN